MSRSNAHVRSTRDIPIGAGREPPLAAHLITPRAFYTHHGIYIGNGRVIHYAGLARGLWRAPVEEVSLDRFARGRALRIRRDRRLFDCGEVVERARSRLGERRYRVLTNNCEHFCAWVLLGECRSRQVERLRAAPRVLGRALTRMLGQYVGVIAARARLCCHPASLWYT